MNQIKIITEEKACDINDIREIERVWSFTIPDSYIDFLLSINGGVMVPATINLKLSNPIYIDYFFSVGDISLASKIRSESFVIIKELFEDGTFDKNPKDLMPIAITQQGGYLYINCKNDDDNYGVIYYANFYGFGDIIKTDFYSIDNILSAAVFEDGIDYIEYIDNFVAKRLFQFNRSKYDNKNEQLYVKRFKELLSYQTNLKIKHPIHGELINYYINNPTFHKIILEQNG